MPDNTDIQHRRSIRLQHYDYASPGGYFVTICSHEQQGLFGEISGGEMHMNVWGEVVRDEWLRTPTMRSNVELDEYVIMPNHFHGIILINATNDNCVGADCVRPIHDAEKCGAHVGAPVQPIQTLRRKSCTLGSIIAGFKSAVTKRINELRKTPGAPVWHRNYYEHVIRNEDDLNLTRDYILNNPLKALLLQEPVSYTHLTLPTILRV